MVSWYSIDSDLSLVERGVANKEDAMRIIKEYSNRGDATHERGEDALTATMFGFQKSEAEFVEICFSSTVECSFTYEISVHRRILFLSFPKIIRMEKAFANVADVEAAVMSFYDMDSEAFQSWLAGRI